MMLGALLFTILPTPAGSSPILPTAATLLSTILAIVHIGIEQLHETLVSGELREPVPSI